MNKYEKKGYEHCINDYENFGIKFCKDELERMFKLTDGTTSSYKGYKQALEDLLNKRRYN